MASTRDVIAPPIFAEDASTTIPPTPIAGQSYRDPVAGPASSPDGWPYAQLVNSAEFNQLMFQWSSLVSIMDLKGILGWSDLKDYTERAIAFGSDGNIYTWLQESGPNTAAGVRDPISEPTYWQTLKDFVGANDTINAPIATVAAAGAINLTTGAPDTSQIEISGTGVSINGFTVGASRFFVAKFSGAGNILVNSASLITGTGANIVAAQNDCFLMRSTAANTVEIVGYTHSETGVWSFGVTSYKRTPTWLDGGTIEAWGQGTTTGTGRVVVTLPLAMANTDYVIQLSGKSATTGFSGWASEVNSGSRTTSTFEVGTYTSSAAASPNTNFQWRVIGKAP